jgi:hypothetical protein
MRIFCFEGIVYMAFRSKDADKKFLRIKRRYYGAGHADQTGIREDTFPDSGNM